MIGRIKLVVDGVNFWMRVPRSGGERYARYADVARYAGMSISAARRNLLKAEKLGLVKRVEVRYKTAYALNWYLTDKGHEFKLGWLELPL